MVANDARPAKRMDRREQCQHLGVKDALIRAGLIEEIARDSTSEVFLGCSCVPLVHDPAAAARSAMRPFARPFAKAIIRERTQDKVAGEGFDGTTSPRAATPQISH
jgi:hypothetical protein